MTIELTHEQAGLIKILASQPCANNMLTADQFELIKEFLDYAGQHHYIVSSLGREALAAYDAKWSTVRRDDLQVAVEELAAKIEESDAKCHLLGLQSEIYKLDGARAALARLREAVK